MPATRVIIPAQPRGAISNKPETKAAVWRFVRGVIDTHGFNLPEVHWGLQFETMYRLRNAIKYAVACRATKKMIRQICVGIVEQVDQAVRGMNEKVKKNRRNTLKATRDDKFVRDVLAGIVDLDEYLRNAEEDASDADDDDDASGDDDDDKEEQELKAPRRAAVRVVAPRRAAARAVAPRSRAAAPVVVEDEAEELAGGAYPEDDQESGADAADEGSAVGVEDMDVDEERKVPAVPSTRPVNGRMIPRGNVSIVQATSPDEQGIEERLKAHQEAMMERFMERMMNQLGNMHISRPAPDS